MKILRRGNIPSSNITNTNTICTKHTNITTNVPIFSPAQTPSQSDNILHESQQTQYDIQPSLLSMVSINTSYSSYIKPGMCEIHIQIIKPWSHQICNMGDTGANINAISECCAHYLYKKYIQTDRRAFRVRTGGGHITCQQYIPLSIKSDGVTLHHNKFYIILDLPFDYLVGRPLSTRLAHELVKIHPTISTEFHHKPHNLDSLSDENMVDYPWPARPVPKTTHSTQQPQPQIADQYPKLTKYIHDTLINHGDICAKREFDIGRHQTTVSGHYTYPLAEHPQNIDLDEIKAQLEMMVVRNSLQGRNPWISIYSPEENGEARIVFNGRKLNAITKRLAYSAQYPKFNAEI